MASLDQTEAPSTCAEPAWRVSGLDFDREGRKSTLNELLQMGGFFPLSKIQDRLPFSAGTLRKWAKADEFRACFMPIRVDTDGRAVVTLVQLNRLDDHLSLKIQC